jgi:transposase
VNPYEPRHPHVSRVWKRLTEAVKESRLMDAQRREEILKAVAGRRKKESERAALKRLGQGMDRSTFRRWQNRYQAHGFDGLLDWRLPPESAAMPEAVREAICTLRRADPNCPVQTIVAHVERHHGYDVSETKVKTVLREAGLSRRRGPPSRRTQSGEMRLELAGMKLVEAACVQTRYLGALTDAVVAQAAEAIAPRPAAAADAMGRDEFGRFRADYNEQYRKQAGDSIGPGFASVEEKRKDKEAERFHLNQVRPEIVERKMWALLSSPLLGSGRWDGIRVPRGELLQELCGFPYMRSTCSRVN